MQFDAAMEAFGALHRQYGPLLDSGLLVFVRMFAFVSTGPIFNRKNIPAMVKVIMAMLLTATMLWVLPIPKHGSWVNGDTGAFMIQIVLNAVFGAMIGFIADMILQAAYTAGNLVNNQIGLSQAMIMDPSQGRQTMILESLYAYITTLMYMHMGGVYWMIMALERSFKIFPLYDVHQHLTQAINLDYLILVSGNVLIVGVQLMAPIMVVTIALDIMLGIVNRAAQQMPVFQLSMALKPSLGIAIVIITMPIFMTALRNYLNDFAKIF